MFDTEITEEDGVLRGPMRQPRQLLSAQDYDGHASVHDDETARSLGFRGGTIEGPTHFSQFVPLACSAWGERWLERGCLSAHYRAPAYDGDEVRAFMRKPGPKESLAEIWMERADGVEILRGSASIGPDFPESALESRMAKLDPLEDPVILSEVRIGTRVPRVPVRMGAHNRMSDLYPFSLSDKLKLITEPSAAYETASNRWNRAIVPFEMISVLMQHTWDDSTIAAKGPALGMFADQEIRLLDGPVFVDEPYEVEREVAFLSGSRRTESVWIRSYLYRPGEASAVAMMLLNCAFMKESYAPYEEERRALYGT
ncbi:MAG: hypothetical protein VYD64_09580 [Pseudomonadota bacterium]|nr:hypothetical protein [Pseudomonadota bacterium]